jgi:hypothetical protein
VVHCNVSSIAFKRTALRLHDLVISEDTHEHPRPTHSTRFAHGASFTQSTRSACMGQAFLVNRSPKLMLFTINPDENLINKKCITISLMFFSSIGQYILGQI